MNYALNTGTIIAILNRNENIITKIDKSVFLGKKFIIPPIVDYEIQRGLLYKYSPNKEKLYFALRKVYGIGIITEKIWIRAAHVYVNLRKSGFTVGDDDIFIASFCIENNYILITRNIKDFVNISDLYIENWVDNIGGI